MKISQQMIAELSGVSRGTVDRVLHGKPNVKLETRKRVLEAIERLNYSPNMAGRTLALSNRKYSICIVLPDNPFFCDVRPGIQAALDELSDFNLSVSYIVTNGNSTTEIAHMIDEDQSGAFMVAVRDVQELRDCIKRKTDMGIPVVTFNTDLPDSGRICFVGQNLYKSGCIAASLMKKLLHENEKRLLIVTGSDRFRAHRERVSGFCDVIRSNTYGIEIAGVIETEDDPVLTYDRITEALSEDPMIDGIYIASANMRTAMQALTDQSRKYRVVVNDLLPEIKEALQQDIVDFTIFQNPFEQGYRPVKLLFESLFSRHMPTEEFFYTDNSVITSEMI